MWSTPQLTPIQMKNNNFVLETLAEMQAHFKNEHLWSLKMEDLKPTENISTADEKDEKVDLPNILKMDSTPKRAPVVKKEGRRSATYKAITTEAVPTGFEVQDSEKDTFEIVPGRLTMASEQTHYRVTTEEMRRRIEGVEQMNVSNLACNLKRTKDNGGGERLRNELKAKGIEVVRNKRQKSFTSNSFVALTEGEAVHLARDLEEICEEIYPATEIAKEVFEEAGDITKEELQDFQFVMQSMGNIFGSVVPPISGIRPKYSDSEELNKGMEILSQGTHGFGIVSQPNWIRQMSLIGSEMEAHIDSKGEKPAF